MHWNTGYSPSVAACPRTQCQELAWCNGYRYCFEEDDSALSSRNNSMKDSLSC